MNVTITHKLDPLIRRLSTDKDGEAEIRLGFAHSALGKKLVDKKYFADELTQLYIDHGFYALVTAAAVGIKASSAKAFAP